MENISAIVGANLSALRKAKGLTQQELASEIHYSDKSISKWELGYSCPSVDVLMDFGAYFGVSLEYLVSTHEEGEAADAIAPIEETKNSPLMTNKFVILGLTMAVVILADLSLFFTQYLFTGKEIPLEAWSIFPWVVPICSILAALEVKFFFRDRFWITILLSVSVWSLLLCLCLHQAVFFGGNQSIWFILILGIPIQAILVLLANWKKTPKKKPSQSKQS